MLCKKLQELLEVPVILARPPIRIIFIIVALGKPSPGREALQKGVHIHFKDILAVKLIGIDMEMVSTSIQILAELFRS